MKKELEDFYFDLKLPVSAIVQKLTREDRISKPAIQVALENIWMMIDTGKIEIKRTDIVKTVRKLSRKIEASEKREIYTRKYESERKELAILRAKKVRYENIRRTNIHDLAMTHVPYWIMVGSILALVYFFGGK